MFLLLNILAFNMIENKDNSAFNQAMHLLDGCTRFVKENF